MSEQEKPKNTHLCWINIKTVHIEAENDKTLCGVSITPMWTGRLGAEFETTCKKCAQKAGEEVMRLTSVATRSEGVKPKRKDNTSKKAKSAYANRRLAALDEAAVRSGFTNWRALEVAVKDGNGVTIPAKS